ncbi:fibrillarin-like rRNA/tRNA 2'-O-methyltransferase [Candidatus Woesearchaeota archaeon]|nr:fibrillarin-like rRNA/tRNA 2'-O-methyltransferase [Candidatus Woesearchaeota archaeon]
MRIEEAKGLAGIFVDKNKNYYTKNLVRGESVYSERLVLDRGSEYRAWDPTRSKLAAALKRGLQQTNLRIGDKVLYLGAATGTTPSHISDIVGRGGFVFALDFAPRVVRELVFLSEKRPNMTPVMADANQVMSYAHLVTGVDFVYMDLAQKNQAEIFIKNVELYLKKEGFGMLFVKSRSIDISRKPFEIYKEVKTKLENAGLVIVDSRKLDPYEKDHSLFLVKKK